MGIELITRDVEGDAAPAQIGSSDHPENYVRGWIGGSSSLPELIVLSGGARKGRGASRIPFVAGTRQRRAGGALDIRASAGLRGPRRSLASHGFLRFPADRIFKGVIEALTPDALEAKLEDVGGWARSYRLRTRDTRDQLSGRIGFRLEPSEATRKLLDRGGPLAIKAHFALWARQFSENEGTPGSPVPITLSRFCDDLGFARLRNGAHRPEHKRQAAALLDLLSLLELDADYRAPDGRTVRLRGPIWKKFELDGVFTVAPGEWFAEPAWREFNGAVGLVGEGLLKLRQDRDRWTICVAGYLVTLARMNGYRPLTLRLPTLEERTGLIRAERRNPARRHETLERALDRCVEAGMIASWGYGGVPGGEPDMDSPKALTALAETAGRPDDWQIVIHWPAALRDREVKLELSRERRRKNRRAARGVHTE